MNKTTLNIDKGNWKLTRLGDLATEISKRIDDPYQSGINRFVGLQHFISGNLIINNWGETDGLASSTKAFEKGDILFARRNAYLRRASLVDFDGVCSGDAFVLKENHDKIVPGFLAFIVNSNSLWDFANSNAAGTMSKRVKWRDLAEYKFLLPPKDQQKKIAELLWAMDDVIETEINLLLKTNILQNSLYKKFRNNSHQWKCVKLGQLMKFHYGKALKENSRINGEFPVVSSSGIQGYHNSFICNGPGIVVGRKGNVGEITWVQDNFWPIDTAYYITINKEYLYIPLKFFYYLLKSADLMKYSIATAVPGLNRDDALLTNVYIPTNEELKEYLRYFEMLDNQIREIEQQISTSKSLQKSLINQIF